MSRKSPHKHAELLSLCHGAYWGDNNPEKYERRITAKGYEKEVHINGIDYGVADAYIYVNKNEIVIAFQATEQHAHEWTKNLTLGLVPKSGGIYIHRGFDRVINEQAEVMRFDAQMQGPHKAAVYDSFLDSTLKEAQRIAQEKKLPVVVCGHSLGGALACLAVEEMGRNSRYGFLHEQLSTVVTFAAPRVGNTEWRQSFDNATLGVDRTAYVSPRDLVPKMPPKALGFVDNMPVTTLADRSDVTGMTFSGRRRLHGLATHSMGLRKQELDPDSATPPLEVESSSSKPVALFLRPPAIIGSYITRAALSVWTGTALREMQDIMHDIPQDVQSCMQRMRQAISSRRSESAEVKYKTV